MHIISYIKFPTTLSIRNKRQVFLLPFSLSSIELLKIYKCCQTCDYKFSTLNPKMSRHLLDVVFWMQKIKKNKKKTLLIYARSLLILIPKSLLQCPYPSFRIYILTMTSILWSQPRLEMLSICYIHTIDMQAHYTPPLNGRAWIIRTFFIVLSNNELIKYLILLRMRLFQSVPQPFPLTHPVLLVLHLKTI